MDVTALTKIVTEKALKRLKRYVAPFLTESTFTQSNFNSLLIEEGLGDLDWLAEDIRSQRLITSELDIPTLRETFPAAFPETCDWLLEKSKNICEGKFSELGSQTVDLTDPVGGIRWNEDFKSGVSWPLTHFLKTRVIKNDTVSDIKTVWELSRFQFAPNLAQMELLTGNESFRDKFIELVDDWQRKNPYPQGPNWNCAMEISIRTINILLSLELFEQSKPLPLPFLKSTYTMLFQSGRHIWNNLEVSARGLNTNHYLADLIGLMTLGKLFEGVAEADEWLEFAVTELTEEIVAQTNDDGFCYESSSTYHLLVLEFYLYTLMFCRHNRITLPVKYIRRLSDMVSVTSELTNPNGLLTPFGDNDSGRLFKLADRVDRDPLWMILWGTMEGVGNCSVNFGQKAPESFWFYGTRRGAGGSRPSSNSANVKSAAKSRYFRATGLVSMRHDDLALSVNVGDVGSGGIGGHKHNDQLSLSLVWGKDEYIIDPGTFCYTTNETERNRLRSVKAHSTISLNDQETNRFLPRYLFAIRRDGAPNVTAWLSTREIDLLRAEHNCYTRLTGSPIVARTVFFNKLARYWLIRDEVITDDPLALEKLTMSGSLIVNTTKSEINDTSLRLTGASGIERSVSINLLSHDATMKVEAFEFAPAYGVMKQGQRMIMTPKRGSNSLLWGIFPSYQRDTSSLPSAEIIREKLRLLEWPDNDLTLDGSLTAKDVET